MIDEKDEKEDEEGLDYEKQVNFSEVSEYCHKTKVAETGISNELEKTISTCFITMLHLANDQNLGFDEDEDDFGCFKLVTEE